MPPKGTAGLARSAVRGIRRLPSPPASTIARTFAAMPRPYPFRPWVNQRFASLAGIMFSVSPAAPADRLLRVDLLTREYPPDVYGGAGVHAEYLARSLGGRVGVHVRCFGEPRTAGSHEPDVTAYPEPADLAAANAALRTVGVDVDTAAGCAGADVVHSHTWYANLAGHLAKLLYGVPHVVTTHSLEPLRPWKAEQLGGGYALSSWCEKTAIEAADAIIAVSAGMALDIRAAYPDVEPDRIHVVHNGIDTDQFTPDPGTDVLERYGIDPARPSVVYVGRITRQKGVPHLLRADRSFPADAQLVLLAGAPDTREIAAEVEGLVADLRAHRDGIV